jgi:pimeloyl-ACP methyl ester carboxylesterase
VSLPQAGRLNHVRVGSGEPLLLVHGLGGYLGLWRPVLDRLAAERDVIAVDLPGFGRSPLPDGFVPSATNLARVLTRFCSEQGVKRPAVAGNSLGAWVALEMARQGNAASVVGLSPAGLWRKPLGPRRHDIQRTGRVLRPLVAVLLRSRRGRARMLRTFVAHPDRVPRADARDLIANYLGSLGYPAANAQMRSHAFDGADEVEVPVTLAWGAEDRLVGRPSPTRTPAHARYIEVPGWGHTPTWDDPEGVARLILEATSSSQFPDIAPETPATVRRES